MKSYNQAWDEIHSTEAWGKYPSEDVVRFFARNFKGDRSGINVLDLGCGGGANTWYLAKEGFNTYAIDGAKAAVDKAQHLLSQMGVSAKFACGDIAQLPYEDGFFDVVLDCAVIHCNTLPAITHIIGECSRVLASGGSVFSTGNFNNKTTGYGTGTQVEPGTFEKITTGALANRGTTHFFSEDELYGIYNSLGLSIISVDEATRTEYNREYTNSYYMLHAKKRNA